MPVHQMGSEQMFNDPQLVLCRGDDGDVEFNCYRFFALVGQNTCVVFAFLETSEKCTLFEQSCGKLITNWLGSLSSDFLS